MVYILYILTRAMVAAREGERTGYNKIRDRTIVTITRKTLATSRLHLKKIS